MTSRASRRLVAVSVATLMSALAATASAQSLADVARAEEARRKAQPKAVKVYTNESVKADITPSAPPVEAGASAPVAVAEAAAGAVAPPPDEAAALVNGEVRDQAYWQGRMTAAREQLERSRTFAEALQTRINALNADFVNRDDPAQQRVVGQNRTKAVAELDRVQREIASHTKAITAIEDEGRKAGVPAGWLR